MPLANKFGWGPPKRADVKALLDSFTWQDISHPRILATYGEIDAWSQAQGRKMGKNDVWIAATSRETGTTILTTDNDFDHLHGPWVDREWVDPSSK
jgi:tRNA(fMet)-specific endonuclease VapC